MGWGTATFFISMFVFIWVASWIFGSATKSKVKVTDELLELLLDLCRIGYIKNELPPNARGWCNSLGLFVQLREKGGLLRLQAGDDKYLSQIDAWRDDAGEWKVKKYNPGDWEKLVNPTLDIATWLSTWGGLPEEYMDSFIKAVEAFKKEGHLELPDVKKAGEKPLELEELESKSEDEIAPKTPSNIARARTEQPKEWQPLEEVSLPMETFEFLAKILPKTLVRPSGDQAPTDRYARIRTMVDELGDHQRIFVAGKRLLDLIGQAHHDKNFRQAMGWQTWFLILQIYSERYRTAASTKDADGHTALDKAIEFVMITNNAAIESKDYDALLMSAGFWDWVGLSKECDQTVRIVREQIGEQGIADRLLNMKRQPLMLV